MTAPTTINETEEYTGVSMKKVFLLWTTVIMTMPLISIAAEKSRSSRPTFTFYLENDVFFKIDQNYTHGCGFNWITPDYGPDRLPPRWTRPAFRLVSWFGGRGNFRNLTYSFRQNVYTPKNIKSTELIIDDQPYAGISFAALGFHQKDDESITTIEFDVGIIGPSSNAAGGQKQVHRWIDSPTPNGWHLQLENELILNVHYLKRWALIRSISFHGWGFEFFPHVIASLGNMVTQMGSGAHFRFGFHIPKNFGTYTLQPGCDCDTPEEGDKMHFPSFGVHIFTTFEGFVVAHNIFLDGNSFRESHSVDKYPLVGVTTIGFGILISKFQLNYSNSFQTKTFIGQPAGHRFGGFTLSYTF